MLVVDLCGGYGGWSQPWVKAGHKVLIVDPLAPSWTPLQRLHGQEQSNLMMTIEELCSDPRGLIKERPAVVLAAPPCTEFSVSGARWWPNKAVNEPHKLSVACETVLACLKFIHHYKPYIWALENPRGRIARVVPALGDWKEHFDPCNFAGYIEQSKFPQWKDDECKAIDAPLVLESNRYTKDTYLWDNFNSPQKRRLSPVHIRGNNGEKYGPIDFAAKDDDRWRLRAATPSGFAEAFYWANKDLRIKI